jgi:hypothetical protein
MLARPAAIELVGQAIASVRPMLITGTTKQRTRVLWAAVRRARNLAAADVVHAEFMALAVEVGMIDERGRWLGDDVHETIRRHGARDISHVIAWAQRGKDPFEGPLQ